MRGHALHPTPLVVVLGWDRDPFCLLSLRNDVGLLAEEYEPDTRRQLGNILQAFSHVGLVNSAFNLTPAHAAPVRERAGGAER